MSFHLRLVFLFCNIVIVSTNVRPFIQPLTVCAHSLVFAAQSIRLFVERRRPAVDRVNFENDVEFFGQF